MSSEANIEVNSRLTIPAEELAWKFSPSGGPGGQHANKANTRAEVVYEIADSVVLTESQRAILMDVFGPRLRVVADDTRSQMRNRQMAADRLKQKLSDALQPKRVRRPSKPGRGAKERRLAAKRKQSQRKAGRRLSYDD